MLKRKPKVQATEVAQDTHGVFAKGYVKAGELSVGDTIRVRSHGKFTVIEVFFPKGWVAKK